MNKWTLQIIIKHFDAFVKNVDFKHLPEKQSEEYRALVLKTANDELFLEGRYSQITEWILEMFDIEEVNSMVCDLTEINKLTPDERTRLNFYLDLKEVCYPLFHCKAIDWTAWPWNMPDATDSLDNKELFDYIISCEHLYLSAVILEGFQHRMFCNEGLYSSVARNESSRIYQLEIESNWKRYQKMSEEEQRELAAGISQCADDLWNIENHIKVGQLLGMGIIEQSIYDAIDTFIDTTYRYNQVRFSKELGEWVHANMTIGEPFPSQEEAHAFDVKMHELMEKYDVSSENFGYTWNLITVDTLGWSLFSEEEIGKCDDDDNVWGENFDKES